MNKATEETKKKKERKVQRGRRSGVELRIEEVGAWSVMMHFGHFPIHFWNVKIYNPTHITYVLRTPNSKLSLNQIFPTFRFQTEVDANY